MPPTTSLIGKRFGRIIIIRQLPPRIKPNGWRIRRSLAQCDCGKQFSVDTVSLTTGNTKSCGCLKRDLKCNFIHGKSRTKTYQAWNGMLTRCTNPKRADFPRYGGRGITVCKRWFTFANFLADMGECPDGKSLDRYPNNDGNYEPGNCRWASLKEQARNKRTTHFITVNGIRASVTEFAETCNLKPLTIIARLRRGWTENDAVLLPKRVNQFV